MPLPGPFRPKKAEVSSYMEAGGPGSGPTAPQSAAPTPDPRPLTSSEHAEALAEMIRRSRMEGPAALLLGTFKPLAWVGGQFLWALQPFVGGTRRSSHDGLTLAGVARFLEQEGSVDDLLNRLHNKQPGQGR